MFSHYQKPYLSLKIMLSHYQKPYFHQKSCFLIIKHLIFTKKLDKHKTLPFGQESKIIKFHDIPITATVELFTGCRWNEHGNAITAPILRVKIMV